MNAKKLVICSLVVLFCLSSFVPAAPRYHTNGVILYVKEGTSGDCTSWATACDLQTALGLAVTGDQVWVTAGTYKPTTDLERDATFLLESGVAVYGGFPTAGGDWGSRDWETNLTTLSGNIGDAGVYTDNSYHVVSGNGVDATAILDGFTISDGNAGGQHGAGMINNNSSSPTLANLTFAGNRGSQWGGGIYNGSSSNPTLTNILFSGNSATAGCGMGNDSSSPTLTHVTFSGNLLPCNSGGGMYNNSSSPILNDVTFSNNTVSNKGGGMYNFYSNTTLIDVTFSNNSAGDDGGAIFNQNSSPSLTNVTISDNTAASEGGGMYNYISCNPTLTNVTFSGNKANGGSFGDGGGGMFNYQSNPILNEVTFTGNTANASAEEKGGGMYNYSSSPSLTEVTFTSNSAKYGGGGMYNEGTFTVPSSPTLVRVTFSGNTTEEAMGTYGGGMHNDDYCSPTLTDVTFSGNRSGYHGGGMYNSQASNPTLNKVTFSGNSAHDKGGGMYNTANSPSLTNVTFSGNWVDADSGGGMYNQYIWENSTMTNVTFYGNLDGYGGGGGMYNVFRSPIIINAIFWGNDRDQIAGDVEAIISYSDVQGGYTGTGNINADPLLGALADNGGFTKTLALGEGSPAIDVGNPAPATCPPNDQRGGFRPLDGNNNGAAICDMGAYEYGTTWFYYYPLIEME